MKASFRLSGLRKVVIALLVGIFAIGTWQTVSAKDNQNGNFLTSVFGSLSNLFVENKTQNLAAQNNQVLDDLVIGTCDTAGPIEVESTGGVTVPTAYATLKASFDAIIAGTHTGAINIEVCGNTTETAAASLDASGTGSASYTSVTIRPVGGARVIEGSIATSVIKLNGADNVTIDGRQGGTGSARDLTVRNNSTAAGTAAIWLASVAAGNGAANNTVRNLEIATGVDQTTSSTNTTIGIIMSGTTVSLTANGTDNDNNSFIANRIIKSRYGIVTRGTTTNLNEGLSITDNIIGPTAFGSDQIGKTGILLQADTGALVSRNTIQFLGCLDPQACTGSDRVGIGIGSDSWSITDTTTITSSNYTVTRNILHDLVEETTFSMVGIKLATTQSGSATGNLVANNFIYNLRANGTSGDQFAGIGVAGGNGDRIVFNSISITGDVDPLVTAASTQFGNAIRINAVNAANNANFIVRNNSIYMDASSSSTTALRNYAITLASNAYSFGTGALNNNNYYINPANTQLQTGGLGTATGSTATTQFATLANWQAALTTPQDANSIQADPQYISNTADLHIATTSPNADAGVAISGVTNDIDGENRVDTPDIGADEQDGVAPPANDIAATAIITPITGTAFLVGSTTTPQASFTNVGSATQTGVQVTFTITGPGGYSYSNTQTIASIAPNQTSTVTFTATPAFTTAGNYTTTATVTTPDANSGNNTVAGSFSVYAPITGGTVNVGTGEAYTSLTNPAGIFDAINNGTVTSNVVINVTSNLTGETGARTLNEIAGGFTVTIKPTGAARTITGTSSAGLIGFNGTDNVTIDGSLSGGTDRSLTITSTNAGATGGGIYFASGAAGAQNNIVKNVNVVGNGSTTGMLLGIAFGGNTFGGVGADNDNNRVENCDVRGAYYGIASLGASSANKDTGLVITRNVMPSATTAGIGRIGIYVVNADGMQVTENNIASVSNPGSVDTIGIAAGTQGVSTTPLTAGSITNANISRNYVGVVNNNATYSAVGIVLASDTSGTNNVVNNMITGVISDATSGDFVAGIYVNPLAGSTQNIYHNSVSMTGNRGATASMYPSYALAIAADFPVNAVDNILTNSQTRTGTGTGGESYAIGFDGPAANANLLSNYNDLFVSGSLGVVGITGDLTTAAQAGTAGTGTNQATLAAWQTATSEDANSISSDPLFTSATDLHIPSGSPAVNVGTSVGVTTDYDGQTRDATPDIGADEFVVLVPGTLAFSSATYSIGEGGGTVTLTVNRTGGTDGAVAVNYTLGGGTATGGAACGGAVDYVNTGGTVNFANGEASKTFNVTICNDVVFEGNETFDATLAGATGGATIGTPNPATVTITDDEVAQPGTLAFSSAAYTVGEGGGTVTLTVNRTGGTDGAVAVNYTLGGGTATGGAACGGAVDYVNTGGTVNFANGEASKTFNVTVCDDSTLEGNETFDATLAGATGGATIGTPNPATVTITDNEVAQPGTLQFSSATYTVGESGGTTTLTVTRTGGSDGAVAVNYATANGTATGGASCAAGIDYVSASGTLNFANGETSKTFNVTICGDTVFEGNETFTAALSGATGGATIGSPSSATVTITEDDAQPTVQFSSATYSTAETLSQLGAPGATITVTLTGTSQSAVTVNYATSNGTATGGATCAAGVDYISTSGTLTFNSGETSKTFFVTTCGDTDVEGNETVNLTLSSPVGATLGTPNTAVLTITDNDNPPTGPVTVTATAGTATATYNTLTEAVTAINAGTHQGAITVSVNQNTTEPASVVLNGSGAGSASYTSVSIRPGADNVTVSGVTAQGRGLIELNGADNVAIDGDNPATTGTNRNMTLQNTAANTVTFTSVIRVAVAATGVTSADNNIFRNLNILGNATGRNIAAAISTTASENTTFGIFAGPGASTTDGTVAPTAVASVSTSVAAGATATNLVVSNNNIRTAARGVSMNGAATTVFPGLQITGNSVGNPTVSDVDQVYAIGITAQGSADAIIRENTVWVEGYVASSAAGHGINVGVNSVNITGATIERNRVNRVRNNNGNTWSAFGINLGGGNNHVVQNNFVSGVLNNQTTGTGAFGATFGAYGIRIVAGTGHKVYHNSVNLYGAMPGVTSTNLTAAFIMTATTQTGVDVRNNIFANQITGGNPAGTRNVSVALPTGGTATMNLTINNNAYYSSGDANSRLAQVGTTFGTGEYQSGNFDPTSTTPATNFRAYTSALSAAGTNDNASFATTAAPPFTSNSDLHIPTGTATRLESGGAAVGVTNDIDFDTRNATTPDIGADEFAGNPAPANDIAAVAFVTPANGSTIQTGTLTPVARYNNNGTATQTNVPVRFRILNAASVEIYNQTATITTIAPLQNVDVTFPSTTIATAGTYTMIASVENPGDTNTANDSINGTFNTVAPIGGTINVGTGETYTSLTNAGGIFQALNTAGISGNVTINITSDLTAETGAVVLNQLAESGAGNYTVTFKPSGAARVISGTAAASTGLITLNGADRIVFDGSLSGGSDRSLTITNNQTGTSTVVWIRSPNSSNGANNNTFKNCIINGATGATATTTAGILTGSSVTIGGDAEAANNNNTIQNNWIYRVQNSLYLRGGATAPVFDQNWTVVDNEMGSVASMADKNIFRGMLIGNAANFTISRNFVHGIQSTGTTTAAMSGIQLGLLLSNGTVTRNNITDIKNISASGTGAAGISVIATSTASNVTIANNFVSDVATGGSATVASNGFGMSFSSTTGGSGYNVYYNSVNMNTNQTAAQTSAALFVGSTFATAGAIDLRNNILANTQTTGTRYAVYSAAPATVFGTINYNDYFAQNVGFIGGSARPTLADWQTATTQDANSVAVDPLFVSATNLHLQAGSPVLNLGTPIAAVTDDIDGDTRSATTPDIGADEVASVATPGSLQFSSATYSINENGGTQTVTVTRTGGSDGTVSVNYATGGGTATGGASCGGSVDYVSASGTLTFAAGVTSQTFNVTICNDATVEPNETFNYTLSGATGGATIGSPSTAVQTIVDDDVPPAIYSLSIGDAKVTEADAGTTNAVFTVTLTSSGSGTFPVTVQYATANGTATAGADYSATSGTLTFNAVGTQTVTVPVTGDTVKEANETFFVNLSNPSANATIVDGLGVGIIVDRDRTYVSDYDRDYIADYSVYRPSNSTFYMSKSTKGFPVYQTFGAPGDISVPGDYDNDGKVDFALFTPSTGNWTVFRSSDSTITAVNWGLSTDKPVQGDYTGDGKTDFAVYRPSTGVWYILPNSNATPYSIQFGISSDRPVQADYDGDFKTDIAVYRDGDWYILNSSNSSVTIRNWGLAADKPVVGDFDGDGRNDLTVYRDGIWYVSRSLTNDFIALGWGVAGDIPVAADYDADGTTDIAVWRPSTGDWYVIKSAGGFGGFNWGSNGDKPTPASYLPQ